MSSLEQEKQGAEPGALCSQTERPLPRSATGFVFGLLFIRQVFLTRPFFRHQQSNNWDVSVEAEMSVSFSTEQTESLVKRDAKCWCVPPGLIIGVCSPTLPSLPPSLSLSLSLSLAV